MAAPDGSHVRRCGGERGRIASECKIALTHIRPCPGLLWRASLSPLLSMATIGVTLFGVVCDCDSTPQLRKLANKGHALYGTRLIVGTPHIFICYSLYTY